ncbi:MAG: DUF2120 domain-containing protein [Methanobrevibacter sp.]|nr:DUF2120 domain-containing protein [Methanobrevibacter sp.]
MVKLHKVAGNVMRILDAFKGSRPAIETQFILIVRSLSDKDLSVNDFGKTLDDLIEELNGKKLGDFSDKTSKLINRMDEQIRANVHIGGDSDSAGIERMKRSLEELNVFSEYRLFEIPEMHVGVFLVMWKEKSDKGPIFVEVVVSDDEEG